MLIPVIGVALYFFTQVLPEIGGSRSVSTAKNSLLRAIDPERELRLRKEKLAMANTLDNKLKLAQECHEAKMYTDAIELFKSCLTGIGQGDVNIQLQLALAYFENNNYKDSLQLLDEIKQNNPDFNSVDAQLLLARNYESIGNPQKALDEYEQVSELYPGEEARIRYGLLLSENNQNSKAIAVFQESISRTKIAPKFYQKKEKRWTKIAKSELSKLT